MIADVVDRQWDVIVVGAGLGGGIAGRRLAEAGLSVLFVEAGPAGQRDDDRPWEDLTDPAERFSRGYWPSPVQATVDGMAQELYTMLGTGVGGSSALYAAMLERPEPHDIDHTADVPHPTGGWPVAYAQYLPHFEQAEVLLSVCGERNPLSRDPVSPLLPAPPLSGGDAYMRERLLRAGLHPYRKHVGVRYLSGCMECFGRKCARACKMDGRSAGVEPALETGRAAVLDRTSIVAVRGSGQRITHVEGRRDAEAVRLRARMFVLAAGALSSPRVLLASAAEQWPDGCANASGLVGRNLMFHLNESIAIWPPRGLAFDRPVNTISVRDYYLHQGVRYGHVQSIGLDASYGQILLRLRERFDQSWLRTSSMLRHLLRIPAVAASVVLGDARIFKGLLEDLPYAFNHVVLDPRDPSRIRFHYTVTKELADRRRGFRALIKAGLGGRLSFFLNSEPELDIPHACGTLRFGDKPATSVLDADCKAHGIANLYVADASFMPTSSGVNPSLTIAANALRVADLILSQGRAQECA